MSSLIEQKSGPSILGRRWFKIYDFQDTATSNHDIDITLQKHHEFENTSDDVIHAKGTPGTVSAKKKNISDVGDDVKVTSRELAPGDVLWFSH